MEHEDIERGRVLTRREVLAALGVGGGALAAGRWVLGTGTPLAAQADGIARALPACVAKPEQTEGPFFVDARLERSDIRSDPSTGTVSEGIPLTLGFNLSQISRGDCSALPGALIDVWQCDADGVYSGVEDDGAPESARERHFLRGYQRTDEEGLARFTTIFPGWYRGRAVHVHFKVRTDVSGQPYEFTSQLYFDEALTDEVHAQAPYAARGRRPVTNADDGIFRRDGGESLMARVSETDHGYAATFDLGLDLTDAETGRPDGRSGRRGRAGRPASD
ncbi:MAG: intradiol ring-cleavage dioxygenase [Gemmatimonadales bacterium]|uniref:intradiol ring-cleavage dioxygenase n=1 Tax=Candidatus Palauibacter irciniicola TaxID=3056733 RepID=UPI001385C75A|nr:intradiol ring-cleavage dioxygenase [Candidatus Palauibacter irciniicola]MYC17309.1 intradiol ring-cleavage dioxygenase [Gemmatimonadales bacterium]